MYLRLTNTTLKPAETTYVQHFKCHKCIGHFKVAGVFFLLLYWPQPWFLWFLFSVTKTFDFDLPLWNFQHSLQSFLSGLKVGVRVAQVPAHKQSLIVCTAETTQTRLAYISISYGGSIITVAKKKKHIVTAIMMLTESILWSAPINTVYNTAAVSASVHRELSVALCPLMTYIKTKSLNIS